MENSGLCPQYVRGSVQQTETWDTNRSISRYIALLLDADKENLKKIKAESVRNHPSSNLNLFGTLLWGSANFRLTFFPFLCLLVNILGREITHKLGLLLFCLMSPPPCLFQINQRLKCRGNLISTNKKKEY